MTGNVQYFYTERHTNGSRWEQTPASRRADTQRLIEICHHLPRFRNVPESLLRHVVEYATCVDTPLFKGPDGVLVCVHRSHFEMK
jgi:hypothetical protein